MEKEKYDFCEAPFEKENSFLSEFRRPGAFIAFLCLKQRALFRYVWERKFNLQNWNKTKVVQLRRIFLTLSLLFLFPLFPFYSVKSVLRPNYVSNGWLLSNLKVVTFLQIFACFSLNVNFRFFLLFKRLRYTTHYRMSAVIFIVKRWERWWYWSSVQVGL